MLPNDVAAKLFVPFSAKYLVYDSSIPGYEILGPLGQDRSLKKTNTVGDLDLFKFSSVGKILRPAQRTVAVSSYYDELAIAQRLTDAEMQNISFVDEIQNIRRGFGVLNPYAYMNQYSINSSFEKVGPDGRPLMWDVATNVNPFIAEPSQGGPGVPDWSKKFSKPVSVSLVERSRSGRRKSLMIVNPSLVDLSAYAVAGREIPVKAADIYGIETSIKYQNSQWTHVEVQGFDVKANRWVKLVSCPPVLMGSSDWFRSKSSFCMPAGISKIRPVLVAGWSLSKKYPATSWFDDIKISRLNDRFFTDLLTAPRPPTITWKQISPEKYEVSVRGATEPFMLAFGEAFDSLWVARTGDGKSVDPVQLYSTINGFPIDRKGDYTITVEYVAQSWFKQGLTVSMVFLILCFLYLCIVYVRRRGRKQC